MIAAIIKKVFGTKSGRDVKRMSPLVNQINQLEESYQQLTDEQLQAKTDEFKARLQQGETVDDLMCEAFAVVKNACRRLVGTEISVCGNTMIWDMVPFDVQLMGGIALHRGGIAEMATGEGKTLVATMPLYLNALTGNNCQLVTVNDYLARRDSEWMGTIYRYLGLTVGCLQNMQPPQERHEQYLCDITYGTNSEFGFDYLRDMGMASDRDQLVQRDHFYAIVDEIDSILIDEARTPLIISGPVAVSTHQFGRLQPLVADVYQRQLHLCSRLVQEAKNTLENADASKEEQDDAILKLVQVKLGMPTHKQLMRLLEDGNILKQVEKKEGFVRSDNNRGMLQEVQAELFFSMDEKHNEADLTEKGRNAISPDNPDAFIMPDMLEGLHRIDTDPELDETQKTEQRQKFMEDFSRQSEALHNLSQLLKAYCLFEKDVDYVVQNNEVMIVDEHTGRLMPGRRYSDGLHQALEAKEGVKIEKETQTMATITIQNYFRMYKKLSGMTGTAETEANEFHQIYKLDVIVIPTNRPCRRVDGNDLIFKTKREKFNAILNDVEKRHTSEQPVLVGTVSVEDSEIISRMMKRRNIPHNVLNAKNHQHEAEIVARAGQKSAVTVATNMAGRGTDIKLGEGVVELGGLHVIGSARHDSRRIDRQLRGRCSRQGDPGSSQFYVSLEDNLMRLFGSDRIVRIMERFGMEEGETLEHPWLNKSIETAQRRVEQHHFSIRKRTLEYDDVMNKQREVIYGFRQQVLLSDTPRQLLLELVDGEVEEALQNATVAQPNGELDTPQLLNWLNTTFPLGFKAEDLKQEGTLEQLLDKIMDRIKTAYESKQAALDQETANWLERRVMLDAIDHLWQEHLYTMDHLRSSIGLRAYAQKDPLVEYKQEAFKTFSTLMTSINREILNNMFRASVATLSEFESFLANLPQEFIHEELSQFEDSTDADTKAPEQPAEEEPINITFRREMPRVGRNDPCPCGSGKKYKKCCGK
ncbi:MAG: preprotein translocase subunit SecA [Victivallales bacterium]|nr:preprotein translocase subunit SecA [Victivallales bacterium]